ncbi:GntR family transcriptional regulator [Pseudonocardia alni]|uniref:GntR family transcriptional regulator n=1 Tax=Pseudonocardia alni TaxID=33907 RepID=UPI001AD64DC8|nr:GntR family transcriptional regulator [Pseudonocardia alni]
MTPRGASNRIAELLRHQIRDGVLDPGSALPSEVGLAEKHGVSRGTVRVALQALAEEGLIEVQPGIGRRVVGGSGVDRSTAYKRIAEDLAGLIANGTFSPGSRLPSEADLVAQYRVSRNTVRRALKVLSDSEYVVIRHGIGALVSPVNC